MKEVKVSAVQKEKGFFSIFYDLFHSLKLTIVLLILLAIVSIIGTVITQNATTEEYVQRYGVGLYEVLDFFSLFDMYHSWWFSAILLLLVVNLIACSIQRLPGTWRQIFHRPDSEGLSDSMLKILPYVEKIRDSSPEVSKSEGTIRSNLKTWFGDPERIETESFITFFSEKGKFSRLGVYIAHLSIIIILIGGMIGSIFGFKGYVNIFEGETIDRIALRGRERAVEKSLDFSVRCDDFKITYYDLKEKEKMGRHVKEYTSLLTILENGREILKRTVQVNHPLYYKGWAFYQSSYGSFNEVTIGIEWKGKKEKTRLQIPEGETVPLPNTNAFLRIMKYAQQVHNLGEGVQVVLFRPNQEPRAFWLLKGTPVSDTQKGDEFALSFDGVTSKEYTGLQVAKDPGVWVVWTGCALMILGFILSFFFSHQRVWIRIPKGSGREIVLAGSANKNRVGFEGRFHQLADGIRGIRSPK